MSGNKGCAVSYCVNRPGFEVQRPGDAAILVCRNHLGKQVEENQNDHGDVVVHVLTKSPEYMLGFEAGVRAARAESVRENES